MRRFPPAFDPGTVVLGCLLLGLALLWVLWALLS